MVKIELTEENVRIIQEILALASSDSKSAEKALAGILALGKEKAGDK